MMRRIVTALVLCALLALSLSAANPWWFGGLLAVLLVAGAWEWPRLAREYGVVERAAYVLLLGAIAAAGRLQAWQPETLRLLLELAAAYWLLALGWLLLAPQRCPKAAVLAAGVCVLVPAWLALLRVSAEWTQGWRWTLLILALPVAMDTGGFFVGRAFGRYKLAPQVSPGKTWEGVLGGMALVLLLAWFTRHWVPGARSGSYMALCVGAAAFSVVGDLTESMFKRAAGLKDSGRFFPGHGGVLDRIDSITAAAPLMTLGLIWLGAGT